MPDWVSKTLRFMRTADFGTWWKSLRIQTFYKLHSDCFFLSCHAVSTGLTCIREYLRCNGDDDCTDYSDEYDCKSKRTVCRQEYSGIPNIDLASAG